MNLFRFVSAYAAGIIRLHLRIPGRAGENRVMSSPEIG
jgi:hypothetical protein